MEIQPSFDFLMPLRLPLQLLGQLEVPVFEEQNFVLQKKNRLLN